VQGRLRNAPLEVRIDGRCAVCARPVRIVADQDLRWDTPGADIRPLIFEPSVDWSRFRARTILDDY
jgi:hypothetical protein